MKNTHELPRFVTIPGADLSTQPNLEAYSQYLYRAPQLFEPKTRRALLEPVFAKAAEVVGPYGINVPDALHERIMFYPGTYFRAWFNKKDDKHVTARTIQLEGLAFLDAQVISKEAYRLGNVDYIDLLRFYSAHELVHLLSQTEYWMSTWASDTAPASPRRTGLETFRPNDERGYFGQKRLNEGVTDYIAQQIWPYEFPQESSGYHGELELVKRLAGDIGPDPLIQAMLTKQGLRNLSTAMDTTYGKGSLRGLYAEIDKDYLFKIATTPEGEYARSSYEGTHKFLERRRI